jgi:glycosyltransferase involved in cell wall biosynthesis
MELDKSLHDLGYKMVPAPISADDGVYKWDNPYGDAIAVDPLFGCAYVETNVASRLLRQIQFAIRHRCGISLHCGYNRLDSLLFAIFMRVTGRKIFAILDSKYDDKPRYIWKELIKYVFLFPYNGIIGSGQRTSEYARMYGFGKDRVFPAYNSLSCERLMSQAIDGLDDNPIDYLDRPFIAVSRFIPKKNYQYILDCYNIYRKMSTLKPRDLHVYGDGPDLDVIKARVKSENIQGVVFHEWVESKAIAQGMHRALCLLILSKEDQWGNVVNEAVCLNLPVICTKNVGASDSLVKTYLNGFVVELDNPVGVARAMCAVAENEHLYNQFSAGSEELKIVADVRSYSRAVKGALGHEG